MLNKKDFLKYASKLAFPIMIQKFDWNIGKYCRYGNAWIRKPDGDVSFITCEPVYVYSVLLILRYGYRNFGSVCPVLGKRG